MNIDANTRALQHLLVQGFTLYTCPAVTCIGMLAPQVLENHSWAAVMDNLSLAWVEQLPASPLRDALAPAANAGTLQVVTHYRGTYLQLPLDVSEVRHAMSRLEVAYNLGMQPPSIEGMQAIPDDVFEQEAKRRKREAKLKEERDQSQD